MKTTDELLHDLEVAAIDVNHAPIFGEGPPFRELLRVQKLARAAIAERLDRLAELEAQGIRISDSGELYIVVTARCDQETLKVG